MTSEFALMVLLACAAVSVAPVSAHDHAQNTGSVTAGLGATHFPNLGAPRAQRDFLRGGKSYSEMVTLDGGDLIFTIRHEMAGGVIVQKKIWKRISGP
jgi:hypothetical protein